MQINRGVQLGLLHQQLGIDANARISVQLTQTGAVYIWDFATGTRFIVDGAGPNVTVTKNHFEVPKRMQEIFNASDADLKNRWDEGWLDGWTDERETIFTELCMRGGEHAAWSLSGWLLSTPTAAALSFVGSSSFARSIWCPLVAMQAFDLTASAAVSSAVVGLVVLARPSTSLFPVLPVCVDGRLLALPLLLKLLWRVPSQSLRKCRSDGPSGSKNVYYVRRIFSISYPEKIRLSFTISL